MLYSVKIKKTENPDDGWTDKDYLYMDVLYHQDAVKDVMDMICSHLEDIGDEHDWTKIKYFEDFAKDSLERLDTPDFKSRHWYKVHTTNERHHLNTYEPEDVDLFDVLEMIVDCVVAGKARTGEVNKDFLILKEEDMLEKAYWNTVKKIEDSIILEE